MSVWPAWQWASFEELGAADLYALLALRQEVFVIEQACLYRDLDGIDQRSFHLLGWRDTAGQPELVACLRCVWPGVKYHELSLGRVACAAAVRGGGIGKALFAEGLRRATEQFPQHRIRISAQRYLQRFYENFGFAVVSAPYDEDGIEHVEMLR